MYHQISSEKKPAIQFNTHSGLLVIEGRSLSENSFEFYKPLMELIKEYVKTPAPQTTINLRFEYFNTSSSKSILDILHAFEVLTPNSTVNVNWFYEEDDEDMFDVGEDFKSKTTLSFSIIPVTTLASYNSAA